MIIQIKIKLDQRQMPYWSAILMHEGNGVLEVISKTFNPRNKKEFRDLYDNVTVRLMNEMHKNMATQQDRDDVVRMLIQEEIPAKNNRIGS